MKLLIYYSVLFVLSVVVPTALSETKTVSREKLLELKFFGDKMDDKGILDYGDHCNYADDLKRREIARTIPSLLAAPTEESIDAFIKEIQDFLETGRHLCNAKFLLSCDELTERCECGPKSSETFYSREQDICRWAKGSQCVSMELFQGTGVNAMCAANTTCTMEFNNLECNIENLVKGDIIGNSPPNCYCSDAVFPSVKQYSSDAGYLQFNIGILFLTILVSLYR